MLGNTYGQVDVREVRRSIGYISQTLLEKLSLRDPAWEVVATGEGPDFFALRTCPSAIERKGCSYA